MHIYVRRALRTALVTTGLVVAGASMAHAEEPARAEAVLADTGWTPWLALAGVCLVALGVILRRAATSRRSTRSPFTHPALLDRVPTQRGETPTR